MGLSSFMGMDEERADMADIKWEELRLLNQLPGRL